MQNMWFVNMNRCLLHKSHGMQLQTKCILLLGLWLNDMLIWPSTSGPMQLLQLLADGTLLCNLMQPGLPLG